MLREVLRNLSDISLNTRNTYSVSKHIFTL
jgi:hypothetical protein